MNLARFLNVTRVALMAANVRFERRFQHMEKIAANRAVPSNIGSRHLDRFWRWPESQDVKPPPFSTPAVESLWPCGSPSRRLYGLYVLPYYCAIPPRRKFRSEPQKRLLRRNPLSESDESSAFSKNAMARNEYRPRIACKGCADGARGAGTSDIRGYFSVGGRLPVRIADFP